MSNLARILNCGKILPKYFQQTTRTIIYYSGLINTYNPNYVIPKHIRTQYTQVLNEEESLLRKGRNKISIFIAKQRLRRSGFYLLEAVVDKINYTDFFKELNLTDSFYTWFVVTELHIWMLIVRLMAEGEEGRHVRNLIIQALWSDVGYRIKKLGASSFKGQVSELGEQLNAALIAYDEGLLSDDTVLAGALWRRLYQQEPVVSLEHLDLLVKYVRKQIKILDSTTKHELFVQMTIKWEPLKS